MAIKQFLGKVVQKYNINLQLIAAMGLNIVEKLIFIEEFGAFQ